MEHVAELGGVVTGFHVTAHCIDCMCGKKFVKIDKHSREIICQRTVFEKEGLSRKLAADGENIFVYDFCMLYVLRQNDYEIIGKWQLGNDLSSDICGMAVDDDTIYCSIRNGKVITLDNPHHRSDIFFAENIHLPVLIHRINSPVNIPDSDPAPFVVFRMQTRLQFRKLRFRHADARIRHRNIKHLLFFPDAYQHSSAFFFRRKSMNDRIFHERLEGESRYDGLLSVGRTVNGKPYPAAEAHLL